MQAVIRAIARAEDGGEQLLPAVAARGDEVAELDDAAGSVLAAARFSPARLSQRPVAVWIQLPVAFRAE